MGDPLDKAAAGRTFSGVRILAALLALTLPARASSLVADLEPAQRADLDKGELVVRAEPVPGGIWPRIIAYVRVKAPVEAVEKVFRDYANAASYMPGLLKAEVLARPDPDTYDVRYTNAMPVVGEVKSTVRNRFRRQGDTLVMRWNLLEAAHADESTGELRVEPDGERGSLLRYINYVRPKMAVARLAAGAAANEVKKTVLALKKESERRGG